MAIKNLTPNQKIFIQLCKQSGLPEPIPEFQFAKPRRWRIDYFFELDGKKVGLEVQGGLWMHQGKGGRHNRAKGYVGDMEKFNAMAMAGIYLLQIQPKDLLKTSTTEMLKTCLL